MTKFVEAKTRKEAIKNFTGSWTVCKKVRGGWMFFETWTDYEVWKGQK
jgi:hypothetical protein